MKRYVKNIVMFLLIGLVGVATYFTFVSAKNDMSGSNGNMQGAMEMNGGGNGGMSTPPDMPSNNGMNNNDNGGSGETGNTDNGNTPPEKPSGESGNSDMGKPDSGNDNTQGESGDNGSSNSNGNSDSSGNNGGMPNGNGLEGTIMNNNSLSWTYYVVFGLEALVISLLVIYLIMSRCNKRSFKEVLSNRDKRIILVLSVIILTGACTYASYVICNNFGSSDNGNGSSGNNGNGSVSYNADTVIDSDTDITEGEYTSSESDSNAILVNSGKVNIENISVTKTGDSDGGDNTSFYGNNSAIMVKGGSNVTLKNVVISTSARGANGIFSYGGSATTNNSASDGTTVNISNSKITTTGDNSGGIMTTGGGIMNASNLTVETSGISSAAIRSDRGGGTVTVNGGTYKTTGQGSPSIYSTANISVSNATLEATSSEGVVIEGKNSVSLDSVKLVDTNNKLNGKSTTYKNIFLYQSMSGDASDGTSSFSSKNSTITTNRGDVFYITNTKAVIDIENNSFISNDGDGYFLRAKSDSWGNSGSNGGDVTLNMVKQSASGNIYIDSISSLVMNMSKSSYYEGAINGDNTGGDISLKLDSSSKIRLTGDSYVTSLDNGDSSNSNIDFNGYKLYVNGKAIN